MKVSNTHHQPSAFTTFHEGLTSRYGPHEEQILEPLPCSLWQHSRRLQLRPRIAKEVDRVTKYSNPSSTWSVDAAEKWLRSEGSPTRNILPLRQRCPPRKDATVQAQPRRSLVQPIVSDQQEGRSKSHNSPLGEYGPCSARTLQWH